MTLSLPKYSILEIERRWRVDGAVLETLEGEPVRRITDKYLSGTRMRLRVISGSDTVYKLCKKYGPLSRFSQPITNLYLSKEEYDIFNTLSGKVVQKLRFSLAEGSLDVYEQAGEPYLIYEVEFATVEDADAYTPASFVVDEVSGQPKLRGVDFAE